MEPPSPADGAGAWIERILGEARRGRASHVAIETIGRRMVVRFRDRATGRWRVGCQAPGRLRDVVAGRFHNLAGLDIAERRLPKAGSFRVVAGDEDPFEVEVAVLPAVGGERLTIRLPAGPEPVAVDLPDEVAGWLDRPGLVVVAGPIESARPAFGALLETRAGRPERVVVVADGESFDGPGPRFVAGPGIGVVDLLRRVARDRPSIVAVDAGLCFEVGREVLDRVALGGRYVLRAPAGAAALLDLGLDPVGLAGALTAVLETVVVRLLCRACRRPADPARFPFVAGGCPACDGTGFVGRRVVAAVAGSDPVGRRALALAAAGQTSPGEAIRATRSGGSSWTQDCAP